MNNSEIIEFVNGLELRCTHCDGNVRILNIDGENMTFTHNLYIPGESVRSNDARCSFFNNDIRLAVNNYISHPVNYNDFKESIIEIARKKN